MDKIRNFSIIAHIDHGKSTLADRLLELTQTVARRNMQDQLLDGMDLEREKGITIKLTPVQMSYKGYQLNLIDTPGHVDFSYEVSKSLQACEGALLVVDASQGIQAQTLANVYLALEHGLTIIPIINKIDLPAADVDRVGQEIVSLLGCSRSDIIAVSAKTGQDVDRVLERIIAEIPQPAQPVDDQVLQALIFDSYYDDYRGIVTYLRIVSGQIETNDEILFMASEVTSQALEIGHLKPQMASAPVLKAGEIGYLVTNLKAVNQARVGDTVTLTARPSRQPLQGYRQGQNFIFAGLFPSEANLYPQLRKALDRLALSDSSLAFEAENSPILGHGFRVGFLGLLHLEIVTERLVRDYQLEVIVSNPSTSYQVVSTGGHVEIIKLAADLPDISSVAEIREMWVGGEIICPKRYLGSVINLVIGARGAQKGLSHIQDLAVLKFEAPLSNLLTDFYDKLKSQTAGYGSLNYDILEYRAEDLVRLDFYVAYELVEALSVICHRSEARGLGLMVVKKLKEIIPRQQFKVALQAAIGGKFIAREDISSLRKDVTAKLYGGDVSRRKKLLEQQKKGKAKMKRIGKVDLPNQAFTVLLTR